MTGKGQADDSRSWNHWYRRTVRLLTGWRDGLVVSALDQRRGREVVGSSPLAAGCRVATVGQLRFAPWAWAYSTLHPVGVGK